MCKPTLQKLQTLSQMVHRVGDKEEKQLKYENVFSIFEIGLLPKDSQVVRGKLYFQKRKREKERLSSYFYNTKMVWLLFSETAARQRFNVLHVPSTAPSHFLPIINIKTRISWQQIFHSEIHLILGSFLVKM